MRKTKALIIKNQNGAVLILVAISIIVLIGMVALAFDVSHLAVAKNELQNAADAGALAAARFLYSDDGKAVDPTCNLKGVAAAKANMSENLPVEVADTDVLRGHWSFGMGDLAKGFYENEDQLEPTELWDVSTAVLDADPEFINAVQVTAHREDAPVVSYFARIFGIDRFVMEATAVAYIGYSGSFNKSEADQPIAICKDSILGPIGNYTCTIGRMINSGTNTATNESAGWVNLTTFPDDNCGGGTNAIEVNDLVEEKCEGSNDDDVTLNFSDFMGAIGGEVQSAWDSFFDCWEPHKGDVWTLFLPVIKCLGNNVSNCEPLDGAVVVNIIWVNRDTDPQLSDIPLAMSHPSQEDYGTNGAPWNATEDKCGFTEETFADSTTEQRQACWEDFTKAYNLRNADWDPENGGDEWAPYAKKSIYFLPSCEYQKPKGASSFNNFGVLARVPKLVD